MRFLAGIAIVVAPIFIGARVLASADRYAEVYVARQPLVPGEHLGAEDLMVGRVRFDGQGARYIAAGRVPVGYVVTRFIGAGELVPLTAVNGQTSTAMATRLVTLPVGTGHAPTSLSRGELVDVYVTPKSSSSAQTPAAPRLVIAAAPVDSVTTSGALASSGTISVVLAVPLTRVIAAVDAIESGTIDVVRVPDVPVADVPAPDPTAPDPTAPDPAVSPTPTITP
jgi:hypothetical protein